MRQPQTILAAHDIVLGIAASANQDALVRLTPGDQQYHGMIWGRTGSGKSRLLQSIFLQHLSKDHAVCLIEPHQDLSLDTLNYLIDRRYFERSDAFDRLLYVDFSSEWVAPFNVLSANLSPKTIALHTLDAMLRVWPELRRAPTFQTLLLASVTVLVENRLPLTALHHLLSDSNFRQQCLASITDPLLLDTFARFGKISGQTQEAGSALRRAFLLSFSDVTGLALSQPENLLSMRQLMDSGRSLIVNLGSIGDPETRRLIGALLLVQIEQAALSRADAPHTMRRPWTVLLDEWPSFMSADEAIGTMLAQTRKFGLRLYLAAQATGQIGSDRLQAAMENCRLTIAFGLGRDSATQQSKQIATLDPFLYREDPVNMRPRRVSTSEQFELLTQELQHLTPQEAYVKLDTHPAIKMRSLSVRDPHVTSRQLDAVLASYRHRYQRPKADAEGLAAASLARFGPPVSSRSRTPFTLFEQDSQASAREA
jgi:energy-coupling factor transporter ATP-binding protein EcfA2